MEDMLRAMNLQSQEEVWQWFRLKEKEQMEEKYLQSEENSDTQTEMNEAVDSRRETQEKKENEKKKKCNNNKSGKKNVDDRLGFQFRHEKALEPQRRSALD
ncbi:Hypothetical predicted protein [Octopus vulgaris]|uniref:Uncharacterized protein n=1 Tax=Octopus vulgaris TaxID=6645 RepID=A0AA36F0M0_OCTVU|nr:Hypothetical predicted protein [Octopus vulgaris]